jgi:hypothetical protein
MDSYTRIRKISDPNSSQEIHVTGKLHHVPVLTDKSEKDEHNDLLTEQGSHVAGPADLLVSAPGAASPRQQVASANKKHRSLNGESLVQIWSYDLALSHAIVYATRQYTIHENMGYR